MKAQKTDEPIIVITEDGFKYKGELIEDKGEVYKLFKNYLTSSQTEISDEEIEEESWGYREVTKDMEIPPNEDWSNGAKWYREQLKSKI